MENISASSELVCEVERIVREFAAGFPAECLRLSVTGTEVGDDKAHYFELEPLADGTAKVTIHVEDAIGVVDFHAGEATDFEVQPKPWSVEMMSRELISALLAVSEGGLREELWILDDRVLRADSVLELNSASWRVSRRFGWRRSFRRATKTQVSYLPWHQAAD